jgi:hypothetical protein
MRRRWLRRSRAAPLGASRRRRRLDADDLYDDEDVGALLMGLLSWPFKLVGWAFHRIVDGHDHDGG